MRPEPEPPAPDGEGGAPPYWRFYAEVAARQLAAWLPAAPARVLDVGGSVAAQLRAAGHEVVSLLDPGAARAAGVPGPAVLADGQLLGCVRPASVDAVVAERRALSHCLATEETLAAVLRALRPGGRLLLCVDSLVLGLSQLAEQGRWAELADAPSADVVLVPTDDGGATRCFTPDELLGALRDAGLEPEWVRPRTVLSPEAVSRALAADPGALEVLVATEVRLAEERGADAAGIHLVASARRPG